MKQRYDPVSGRIVDDDEKGKDQKKLDQPNRKLQLHGEQDTLGAPQPILVERVTREQVIEAAITKLVLDKSTFDTLATTTPDVAQRQYWLSHAAATTVTNFRNGQEGHHLYILGNGNTTVTDGTNIFTSTGANKVLAADKMYHFICHDDKWYEVCE